MSKTITFNVPLNSVSFGQVSLALLREAYNQKIDCLIFPIGQPDLSAQTPDEGFHRWLEDRIRQAPEKHSRDNRIIKLWHLNGALESFGRDQELITFLETDSVTDVELNIIKNQKTVWVTSLYTKEVMEQYGATNIKHIPLGLDTFHFKKLNKRYYGPGITTIGLGGKFEDKRKAHGQIITALLAKYGNNPKFMFHFAIYNPFFTKEQNESILGQLTQGKKYNNVVWLPFMAKNSEYNDFLNSCDIFLGMSNAEGYDLPVYQAAALGKKIVALNAHVYKDYLNEGNAWMVEPNGKQIAMDGVFFHAGQPFNQGSFFKWDSNEFLSKLDEAIVAQPKNNFQSISYADVLSKLLND
jgi:glycosyltransferase involved in cell wall biosynthesis